MVTKDIQTIIDSYPDYLAEVQKNYWRNFILLCFDSSFFTFSTSLLSQDTILPYFLDALTSNPVLIGLIPALFYLGYLLPQIISSFITVNTAKRKKIILVIAIAERIGILFIAITSSLISRVSINLVLTLFFLSYMVYTTTMGLIMPAYSDFISKAIYKGRGMYYGVTQAIGGLIGFAASYVSTILLSRYDFPLNYQYLFWLSFLTSFVSPILIANFREVELPVKIVKQSFSAFVKGIPALINSRPGVKNYIFARQLIGLAIIGNSFFSVYAINHFNQASSVLGYYTMAILLAQCLSGVVWGMVGDRFGYKKVLIAASLIPLLNSALALLSTQTWPFILISSLIGVYYSAIYIGHPNIIFEISPPEQTSQFIGISNTLIAPVAVVAPIIGGKIVEVSGYRTLFILMLIFSLIATLFTIFKVVEPRKMGED